MASEILPIIIYLFPVIVLFFVTNFCLMKQAKCLLLQLIRYTSMTLYLLLTASVTVYAYIESSAEGKIPPKEVVNLHAASRLAFICIALIVMLLIAYWLIQHKLNYRKRGTAN